MAVIYAGMTPEVFSKLMRHYADIKIRMGVRESYCELVQGKSS